MEPVKYSIPMYGFVAIMSLGCMGGHYSLFPTVCQEVFGLKKGPEVYGALFYSFGCTAFLGIFYVKVLLPAIGYWWTFVIFFVMTIAAGILTLGFR